jgi:hypothetical protein
VEAEDIAEYEHAPLPWRQRLQRGDKRELDCLSGLIARLGTRGGVDDPLE